MNTQNPQQPNEKVSLSTLNSYFLDDVEKNFDGLITHTKYANILVAVHGVTRRILASKEQAEANPLEMYAIEDVDEYALVQFFYAHERKIAAYTTVRNFDELKKAFEDYKQWYKVKKRVKEHLKSCDMQGIPRAHQPVQDIPLFLQCREIQDLQISILYYEGSFYSEMGEDEKAAQIFLQLLSERNISKMSRETFFSAYLTWFINYGEIGENIDLNNILEIMNKFVEQYPYTPDQIEELKGALIRKIAVKINWADKTQVNTYENIKRVLGF